MIIKVYDNNGATADRYTVVIGRYMPAYLRDDKLNKYLREVYTMSEDPTSVVGVNQFSHVSEEEWKPTPITKEKEERRKQLEAIIEVARVNDAEDEHTLELQEELLDIYLEHEVEKDVRGLPREVLLAIVDRIQDNE